MSPCPIMGDYTGEVPGTHGLCAKVSSDCNNPDIMFYTVSNCEERGHIYEGMNDFYCLHFIIFNIIYDTTSKLFFLIIVRF